MYLLFNVFLQVCLTTLILLQAAVKVLAGAFRREIALEEFIAKQTSEIMQLNRLVGLI